MGDYTGIAFNFKVKQDAPKEINKIFYRLAAGELLQLQGLTNQDLDRLITATCCGSAYFEAWDTASSKHKHTLRYYREGRFVSYASAKPRQEMFDSIVKFLNLMLPYIECKDGDVLVRTIYEEGNRETVYYFDKELNQVMDGLGYKYRFDHSPLENHKHPRSFLRSDPPDVFVPPNNIFEINKLVEAETIEYDNKQRENHYGFG